MSNPSEAPTIAPDGTPIFRHGQPADWQPATGEGSDDAISAHIAAHLGKVETVFHELVSDAVHVDIHIVPPTQEFPFIRLVTSGMSDLPMAVPPDANQPRHMELFVTLPESWKLDQESLSDERWYWPIRLLKVLARLPHKFNTWLGFGHTIPNGDPADAYAPGTRLCGAVILPSVTVPEAFHTLVVSSDKTIQFFAVVPLYDEEMNLKLRSGLEKLLVKMGDANISDIIVPDRKNVGKKFLGLF